MSLQNFLAIQFFFFFYPKDNFIVVLEQSQKKCTSFGEYKISVHFMAILLILVQFREKRSLTKDSTAVSTLPP